MEYQLYQDLPQEAKRIRELVFMQEQGFQNEFDNLDHHCFHLVLFIDHQHVATCRFYKENEAYIIGRVAVIKELRKQHLGGKVLQYAQDEIKRLGGHVIKLHAQVQAMPFYQKYGYVGYGEIEDDEGCPHMWMKKEV
ncbi:GNAT family N-acetyltransferase [Coprobacillus sp. AF33-1AC]|uniref:GNAT family N-acetyltransferase n=1 Tax=Coprobacillus sp. AF33-1AC TaxID=2292032 RepID=UPI000E4E5015|nr:GNAT family N-acetyltransferase [Coprobacillus sp. AF33-1AC]RHM63135.1 GNAT family N-acetyltransferase [Coprobacillus sp. AF33-1AC]